MKYKKGILLLLTAALLWGCGGREEIVFVAEPSGEESGGTVENVNLNAGSFLSYEYITPTDVSPDQVVWVNVEPKRPQDRPLRVGFSQMEVNNDWRIYENASIFQEAEALGIELLYRDAESSLEKQNADILELIEAGVDYLIVAPRQYFGLEGAFEAAREAGVPVILIDRLAAGTVGVDYVTCIMTDHVEVGSRAAGILAEQFPEQEICVLEVSGTTGSSSASYLSEGFRKVAEERNWEIITVDGNFDRVDSLNVVQEALVTYGNDIDAVFAHIDDSAIGAIQAMRNVGLEPGTDTEAGEIPVVSMGGYKDALKAIIAGDMLATIECSPRFGPIVFYYINCLEDAQRIRSRIVMPGKTYDISNAGELIELEGY
ncbi:MAG: substrate-binding domain-containing protein [Bacillota bacterium]|nr:substrate-binding domain-containing protein [Bacillota bacterium]